VLQELLKILDENQGGKRRNTNGMNVGFPNPAFELGVVVWYEEYYRSVNWN
jgi:hypothetical protein